MQSGFTLLEAMIAIVVISIGLLGLLGLQTYAITATQSSQYRTLASIAIQDIAARMQANPRAADQGFYSAIDSPGEPSDKCRSETPCSPEAMARLDVWQWSQGIADTLPNGRGFVDCARTEAGGSRCSVYRVTIGWRLRDHADDQTAGLRCADTRHDIHGACLISEVAP
ncbi:type IV pilus modification protein PilV [Salinisphaera sp. Q1T1-3]|uniref:type IV pilus modification protein PilV n=1 Tax=Salinisphaera sp. Q1T1-3 TaxID=2321229 RepID=UPI0013144646|nr:type IV pilus modification protein PilV [Salinisphaera sp. Q1T1-3]